MTHEGQVTLCKLWMGTILLFSATAMANDRMTEGLLGWFILTMVFGPFMFAGESRVET